MDISQLYFYCTLLKYTFGKEKQKTSKHTQHVTNVVIYEPTIISLHGYKSKLILPENLKDISAKAIYRRKLKQYSLDHQNTKSQTLWKYSEANFGNNVISIYFLD